MILAASCHLPDVFGQGTIQKNKGRGVSILVLDVYMNHIKGSNDNSKMLRCLTLKKTAEIQLQTDLVGCSRI